MEGRGDLGVPGVLGVVGMGDMGLDQRAYGPSAVETIIPCPSATSRCPQKTVMETQLISTDADGSKFGVEITEKKATKLEI